MVGGHIFILLCAGLQFLGAQDINLGEGPVLVGGGGGPVGVPIGAPVGGVGNIVPNRPNPGNNQLPVSNGGIAQGGLSNLNRPGGGAGGVIVVDDKGTIIPSPGSNTNSNNNNNIISNNNNANNNNNNNANNNINNNVNNNNNAGSPGNDKSNIGGDFNSFGPANFPSFGNFGSSGSNLPNFPGYENNPTATPNNNNNFNNNNNNFNNNNNNANNNNFNANSFNTNNNNNNNNNINNNNNNNSPGSFFGGSKFPSSFPNFGGNGNGNPNPNPSSFNNNNNNVPTNPGGASGGNSNLGFPDLGSINFDFGIGNGNGNGNSGSNGFPSNFGDGAGFFPGLPGGSSNFPRPGGGNGGGVGGGINLPPIRPTNPGSGFGRSSCTAPTSTGLDAQFSGVPATQDVTNGIIQEASVRQEVLALANFFATLVGNTQFDPPVDGNTEPCPANYTRLTKFVTSSNLECWLLPPPYQEPVFFANCRCSECQDSSNNNSPLNRYGGYNNINLNNNNNNGGCRPQLANVTLVSYCPLLSPARIVPFRLEVPKSCQCIKAAVQSGSPYNFRNN